MILNMSKIEFDNLYNTDCMEFMKKLADNFIDLTLTDIPYNLKQYDIESDLTSYKKRHLKRFTQKEANVLNFDLQEFCKELQRITQKTIIIFCSSMQLSYILNYNYNLSNRVIVWKKTNPNPVNSHINYLVDCEFAVVSKKPKATFNHKYKSSVFEHPTQTKQIHPCEKNHNLIAELILDNTKENDIVFDPCSGNGTTIIEAIKLNRKAIGCELNLEYFIKANEKIERFKDEFILYRLNNGKKS